MKLITRNTDYALRALMTIAKASEKRFSVDDLVKELKIPRPFLRKILQVLNKKGILKSFKGTGGGFLLAKPAGRIFLLDLVRIFQGPLKLNECLFKKSICPNVGTCAMRKKIDSIERYAFLQLKPITIASLLNRNGAA